MAKKTSAKASRATSGTRRSAALRVDSADKADISDMLAWLERKGTKRQIKELARYGIGANRPYGVTVGELKKYAKLIGTNHALAKMLWATERYEARMLAAMIDDPQCVTLTQMNAWASDFDNWALVDTTCFHLFDRAPRAWDVIPRWAVARAEYKKRAAFALLWSLSVHDKSANDQAFVRSLAFIEKGAEDERDMVKKGVNMALRAIGKRNRALNASAIKTAERLAGSQAPAPRWVGSHALRELRSPTVQKRLRS